jgi:hypothetical protein
MALFENKIEYMMKIIELKVSEEAGGDAPVREIYGRFQALLSALRKKSLPDATIEVINSHIEVLNARPISIKGLKGLLLKKQKQIVKLVEQEHKIVPKNHYRKLWLVLGMAIFGIPIGVALGVGNHDMSSLGLGLPIGLAIGIAVGSEMDNKAFKEGRQLSVELKGSPFSC